MKNLGLCEGGPCCGLAATLRAAGHADRYELLELVGEGGMSEVFAVWDRRLRRRVAMKRCRRPIADPSVECLHFDPDPAIGAFAAEMQILAHLRHSSIIPLYDFGLDPQDRLFLTMPLVDDVTFLDVIADVHSGAGTWSVRVALGPLIRICDALRYAHSRGIVHADVKPANIAVGATGETYLLDWGLAQCLERPAAVERDDGPSSACLTHMRALPRAAPEAEQLPSGLSGTPFYMPKEYVASGEVSTRFDIYSFGATLYHLIGGHPPYHTEPDNFAVLRALMEREPRRLHSEKEPADAGLVRISECCMARDPEDRYPSMHAVRAALNEYIEQRAERRRPPFVKADRWFRRTRGRRRTRGTTRS